MSHHNGIFVDEFSEHETHDLHRDTGPTCKSDHLWLSLTKKHSGYNKVGRREEERGGRKGFIIMMMCTVFQHLQQRQGGNVNGLRRVHDGGIHLQRFFLSVINQQSCDPTTKLFDSPQRHRHRPAAWSPKFVGDVLDP